ncbi:hypothetical protein D3C81_2084200 [compost metagenome]
MVTSEEAISFRTAAAANEEDNADVVPVGAEISEEVTYTAPAFREEDSTTGGLDQTDASSEVAGKSVEERLQALELAVFGKAEVEAA